VPRKHGSLELDLTIYFEHFEHYSVVLQGYGHCVVILFKASKKYGLIIPKSDSDCKLPTK
jgi:hypothetical protein